MNAYTISYTYKWPYIVTVLHCFSFMHLLYCFITKYFQFHHVTESTFHGFDVLLIMSFVNWHWHTATQNKAMFWIAKASMDPHHRGWTLKWAIPPYWNPRDKKCAYISINHCYEMVIWCVNTSMNWLCVLNF